MSIPMKVKIDGEDLQFEAVSSSNIACVAWVEDTEKLYIRFHNGNLYRYSHIPQSVYLALLIHPSKGSYFHRHIKGVYPTEKIEN